MPIRSSKQYRLMRAAAAGRANTDVPTKVAKEMLAETPKATRRRFANVRQHRRR